MVVGFDERARETEVTRRVASRALFDESQGASLAALVGPLSVTVLGLSDGSVAPLPSRGAYWASGGPSGALLRSAAASSLAAFFWRLVVS